jgi:thioredoxin 1
MVSSFAAERLEMAQPWQPDSPSVTAAELPALLTEEPVVVIHFWAAWNGVERQFEPRFALLRREFEQRIAFRSADVDDPELQEFCRDSEVVNVPALGCFVRGRRIKTIVGARSDDELRLEFTRLIAERAPG